MRFVETASGIVCMRFVETASAPHLLHVAACDEVCLLHQLRKQGDLQHSSA
jgi:hypothetical protein